jgi:hypothetical protein
MPLPASALEHNHRLRLLLMGRPKVGKTAAAVATAPGPVRVLLCEDQSALREAKRQTDKFDFEIIKGWESMQKALVEAKKDAAAGAIKTVVIDPLSDWSDRLKDECFNETLTSGGNEDGRRASPLYLTRMLHAIDKMFLIPAHVIVICHYQGENSGGEMEGVPQTGEGIVPMLYGKARERVAAKFVDVVFMDLKRTPKEGRTEFSCEDGNERFFLTNPKGAWGPGCRSLGAGSKSEYPANIGALIKAFENDLKSERKRSNHSTSQSTQRR